VARLAAREAAVVGSCGLSLRLQSGRDDGRDGVLDGLAALQRRHVRARVGALVDDMPDAGVRPILALAVFLFAALRRPKALSPLPAYPNLCGHRIPNSQGDSPAHPGRSGPGLCATHQLPCVVNNT
jgi:hypothetical protein